MMNSAEIFPSQKSASEFAADFVLKLADRLDVMADRDQLFSTVRSGGIGKWSALRAIYKTIDSNQYEAYPVDWPAIFTPIEKMAWEEIRSFNLPFWPQYPIGKYFADFACSKKKLVIECDGRDFHSQSKDRDRDRFMGGDGWRVYRISGSDCNRLLPSPWEVISDRCLDEDCVESEQIIRQWMHGTVDGLIASIAMVHFARPYARSDFFRSEASHVLSSRLARGI